MKYGLSKLVDLSEKYTDLPIIYDHQKCGTDIPQMGKPFTNICAESGVKGVIIFPQSGPSTEENFINSIKEEDLIPIVGGEMIYQKNLERGGGFIRDETPNDIYKIAAKKGVDYFLVPGHKPDIMKKYSSLLSSQVDEPKFCLPGFGRQGGDIKSAFDSLNKFTAFAIIGTSIYGEKDMKTAARKICNEFL